MKSRPRRFPIYGIINSANHGLVAGDVKGLADPLSCARHGQPNRQPIVRRNKISRANMA
jgi:hypothetical protein